MHCSSSKQGDVTITVIGAFCRCVPLTPRLRAASNPGKTRSRGFSVQTPPASSRGRSRGHSQTRRRQGGMQRQLSDGVEFRVAASPVNWVASSPTLHAASPPTPRLGHVVSPAARRAPCAWSRAPLPGGQRPSAQAPSPAEPRCEAPGSRGARPNGTARTHAHRRCSTPLLRCPTTQLRRFRCPNSACSRTARRPRRRW